MEFFSQSLEACPLWAACTATMAEAQSTLSVATLITAFAEVSNKQELRKLCKSEKSDLEKLGASIPQALMEKMKKAISLSLI